MPYNSAILVLTAICAICAVIGAVPEIKMWFRLKPQEIVSMNSTALPGKAKWLILLIIAILALSVSLFGLYGATRYNGSVVHFPKTDIEHLKYVHGKHYFNEEVKIDGIHFDMCTFDNVTLTYDGTDNSSTSNCRFSNIRIKTNSDPVAITVALLKIMGFIKPGVPVLDKDEKPINSIPGAEQIH